MITAISVPSYRKEVEELEALGAPDGDEETIDKLIAGTKEAIKKAEKDPYSVEEESASPFAGVDKLASEYGFKYCDDLS